MASYGKRRCEDILFAYMYVPQWTQGLYEVDTLLHYENTHMQYTEIFFFFFFFFFSNKDFENFIRTKIDIFNTFIQNNDCRRGGSNENISIFRSKIRKNVPLHTPVLVYV